MFLEELLNSAFVTDEAVGTDSIVLLPKGIGTGIDLNFVVKSRDFENLMVTWRTKEPLSDPILKTLGRASAAGGDNSVYRMLSKNNSVLAAYTKMAGVFNEEKLKKLEEEASKVAAMATAEESDEIDSVADIPMDAGISNDAESDSTACGNEGTESSATEETREEPSDNAEQKDLVRKVADTFISLCEQYGINNICSQNNVSVKDFYSVVASSNSKLFDFFSNLNADTDLLSTNFAKTVAEEVISVVENNMLDQEELDKLLIPFATLMYGNGGN